LTVWGWLPKSFAPLMRAAAVHLAAQTVEVPSKEREVLLWETSARVQPRDGPPYIRSVK